MRRKDFAKTFGLWTRLCKKSKAFCWQNRLLVNIWKFQKLFVQINRLSTIFPIQLKHYFVQFRSRRKENSLEIKELLFLLKLERTNWLCNKSNSSWTNHFTLLGIECEIEYNKNSLQDVGPIFFLLPGLIDYAEHVIQGLQVGYAGWINQRNIHLVFWCMPDVNSQLWVVSLLPYTKPWLLAKLMFVNNCKHKFLL